MSQRGFATWNPTEASEEILQMIGAVLEEYADYLPLTGRTIFYRLVGRFGYEKTDAAANRVYAVLGRARRAGMIPFHVIRDGGGSKVKPQTYADAEGFWEFVRKRRENYHRHRQAGQPVYVELFCESPGMMEQLQPIAFDYSVPVYGTRGFAGLAVIAEIARRTLQRDVPTVLLQVGDYDPSGESIFESIAGDASTFVRQVTHAALEDGGEGNPDPGLLAALTNRLGLTEEETDRLRTAQMLPDLQTERVLLTWEQVVEHDIPTAPVSKTKTGGVNPHGHNWVGEAAQAEAMPPDLLAWTVRDAIEDALDMERYREEVDAEEADLESIDERLPE